MDVKTKPVTRKQLAMLTVCEDLEKTLGRFPSVREIGDSLGGKSTNGIRVTLQALTKKGQLEKIEGVGRGWRFPKKSSEDKALELLRRLKEWESIMGGWDTPLWREVEAFLETKR